MQEKMSHVEELRQIHADINAMETVIKQAEENRSRSHSLANRFHEEYVPLKTEIDGMRRDYLGLDRLAELHEEEGSIVGPERFQSHNHYSAAKVFTTATFTRPLTSHNIIQSDMSSVTALPPSNPGFLQPPPPPVAMRTITKPPELTANRIQQSGPSIGMGHPTFRSDFNVNLRYFFGLFYLP
jgi:zinc finger C4H2 domain-contaning protein